MDQRRDPSPNHNDVRRSGSSASWHFVVTWEPRLDPGFLTDEEWDLLAADSMGVEHEGEEPVMAWPVPEEWSDVSVGAVVYVFRQAVNGHGIVAHGEVVSKPYRHCGRACVDLAMRCVPLAAAVPFELVERAAPTIPWRLLDAEEVHEIVGLERQRVHALWTRHTKGPRDA